MEVEVDGQFYLIGQMKARQQRNVLRRLLPLLPPVKTALTALLKAIQDELDSSADLFFEAVGPLAKAIAGLSDEDSDYVVDTCLTHVKRKVSGGWQMLVNSSGDMQYEDVKLPQQMRLVFYVLKENFADFLRGLPGQSSDASDAVKQ